MTRLPATHKNNFVSKSGSSSPWVNQSNPSAVGNSSITTTQPPPGPFCSKRTANGAKLKLGRQRRHSCSFPGLAPEWSGTNAGREEGTENQGSPREDEGGQGDSDIRQVLCGGRRPVADARRREMDRGRGGHSGEETRKGHLDDETTGRQAPHHPDRRPLHRGGIPRTVHPTDLRGPREPGGEHPDVATGLAEQAALH